MRSFGWTWPAAGWRVLRRNSEPAGRSAYLPLPQAIEFPTASGLTAHAFYYPPANRDFAPLAERPPLLVLSHGGPTGADRRVRRS